MLVPEPVEDVHATANQEQDETLTGVVGDASTTITRSGADSRKRGWFWHWNNLVTQYAPMLGLKGVGLLNSYTVWTDRREESPHRGFAFPSQQSEAEFYGEDRAELITINKILVALDLIEIRKEMVYRTDPKGRRWKVPHNFYRVKDHGDSFNLTTRDVKKVVALAEQDRNVYRYVRRMFSPRFSPIDSTNVWHTILEELRDDPAWQRLTAKATKDEQKASDRTRAGHAARRSTQENAGFVVANAGDKPTDETPAPDRTIDSPEDSGKIPCQTSVATTNNGLSADVARTNKGFGEQHETSVEATNSAQATSVEPSNTMYNQGLTTTTTPEIGGENKTVSRSSGIGPGVVADERWDESTVIDRYEEANDRPSNRAERRLLRELAGQFDDHARDTGSNGWRWVANAIDEAVGAGSTFVATNRIREILKRWEREGLPVEHGGDTSAKTEPAPVTMGRQDGHRATVPVQREPAREREAAPTPEPMVWTAPTFALEPGGITNRQAWSAIVAELTGSDMMGRADVETWLRDADIVAVDDVAMVIAVPHEIARRRAGGRYRASIREAVRRVTGFSVEIEVVLRADWQREQSVHEAVG